MLPKVKTAPTDGAVRETVGWEFATFTVTIDEVVDAVVESVTRAVSCTAPAAAGFHEIP